MDYKLVEQCNKYIKSGKIDRFQNYIKENNLTEKFMEEVFYSTYQQGYQGEELKKAIDVSNFALKISNDILVEKFGEKIAYKFTKIIFNESTPSKRNFDLYTLIHSDINSVSEEEIKNIEQILEMSENKKQVLGTHVIGKDIGDILMKEGINLSGHKFIANDYESKNYKNNVKRTLEKNITFFEDDPIGLVIQMANARKYNNPTGEFNDIMLVSIPKEELEQNQDGIIIEKDEEKYLNPNYIKGYARVNIEKGSIENIINNPNYIDKCIKRNIETMDKEDWEEKFQEWYEKSRTTKMQKYKKGIINFFKSKLSRNKRIENTKEIKEEER